MLYTSTRQDREVSFDKVVLEGLSAEGGLFMPKHIPRLAKELIQSFGHKSYQEIAFDVMLPYVGDCLTEQELKDIIDKSYANFHHTDCCAIKKLDHSLYILELFHGPSFSFKDYALQFLGHLVGILLEKNKEKAFILGATSGDTGSAAIMGFSHIKSADIIILHPQGAVSSVQRKQMTTVLSDNVHNMALEGNFDDCQNLVKQLFRDKEQWVNRRLIAVNSINFARIMAQIVYYFYTSSRIKKANYAVPTGNFGDILAGFLARKMGANIGELIVATNENDILHRCIQYNDYSLSKVVHTLSPSMDIMLSSNFERMLYLCSGRDAKATSSLIEQLDTDKKMILPQSIYMKLCAHFSSMRSSDEDIVRSMKNIYNNYGYVVDPHTATSLKIIADKPLVALATAHPAKFPKALEYANLPHHIPDTLLQLEGKEERLYPMYDIQAVKNYMQKLA